MHKVREKLTFANVVACLALFIALGGASYAATQLPRNSVGTSQIKNGAVTGAKVKPGSLTASKFKGGLPKGPRGPEGPVGPTGPAGVEGPKGEPGPFPSGNLPSGTTLRGTFAIGTNQPVSATGYRNTAESFVFTLASAPDAHFIAVGDTPPAECPGSAENPQAATGNLCVYERVASNQASPPEFFDPATGAPQAGRFGFGIEVESAEGSMQSLISYGTWAVSAP